MSMQVGHTVEARRLYTARIVEMTARGHTAAYIAQELNLTPRSVARIRRRMGVAKPPVRKLDAVELARAEALFDDGCSMKEVARTLGRSQDAIMKHFPGRGWSKTEVAEFAAWKRKTNAVLGNVSSSVT